MRYSHSGMIAKKPITMEADRSGCRNLELWFLKPVQSLKESIGAKLASLQEIEEWPAHRREFASRLPNVYALKPSGKKQLILIAKYAPEEP